MDQKQNIKLIDKSVLKAETDLDMTAGRLLEFLFKKSEENF